VNELIDDQSRRVSAICMRFKSFRCPGKCEIGGKMVCPPVAV
jgi:hypothetical protein